MDLPALPELLRALWEIEIFPDVEMLAAGSPQVFDNHEAAIDQLRRRLYVVPDTEQDLRLDAAARELLTETPDGLVVRGARPRRQALVLWRPE